MRGAISRSELLAANALLQLCYGSKSNAIAHGAVATVAPRKVPALPAPRIQNNPRNRRRKALKKRAPPPPADPSSSSEDSDEEEVPIGTGQTIIKMSKFRRINWKSYTHATRSLLSAVFSRSVLATHSMTGKQSPAFTNKPAKQCLDPTRVADIIMEVSDKYSVPDNLVRKIITTKCADECKIMRNDSKKETARNAKEASQKTRGNRSTPRAPGEF